MWTASRSFAYAREKDTKKLARNRWTWFCIRTFRMPVTPKRSCTDQCGSPRIQLAKFTPTAKNKARRGWQGKEETPPKIDQGTADGRDSWGRLEPRSPITIDASRAMATAWRVLTLWERRLDTREWRRMPESRSRHTGSGRPPHARKVSIIFHCCSRKAPALLCRSIVQTLRRECSSNSIHEHRAMQGSQGMRGATHVVGREDGLRASRFRNNTKNK